MNTVPATNGEEYKNSNINFQNRSDIILDKRKHQDYQNNLDQLRKTNKEVSPNEFIKYRQQVDCKSKQSSFHNGCEPVNVSEYISQKSNLYSTAQVRIEDTECSPEWHGQREMQRGKYGHMAKSATSFELNPQRKEIYQNKEGNQMTKIVNMNETSIQNNNNLNNERNMTKVSNIQQQDQPSKAKRSSSFFAQDQSYQGMSFGVGQQYFKKSQEKQQIVEQQCDIEQEHSNHQYLQKSQQIGEYHSVPNAIVSKNNNEVPPKAPRMKYSLIGVSQEQLQNKNMCMQQQPQPQQQCNTARSYTQQQDDLQYMNQIPLKSERIKTDEGGGTNRFLTEKSLYEIDSLPIPNYSNVMEDKNSSQIPNAKKFPQSISYQKLNHEVKYQKDEFRKKSSENGAKREVSPLQRVSTTPLIMNNLNKGPKAESYISLPHSSQEVQQQLQLHQQPQTLPIQNQQHQQKSLSSLNKKSLILPKEENIKESVGQLQYINSKLSQQISILQKENGQLIERIINLQQELKQCQISKDTALDNYLNVQKQIEQLQLEVSSMKIESANYNRNRNTTDKQQISDEFQQHQKHQTPQQQLSKNYLLQLEDYPTNKSDISSSLTKISSSKSTSSVKQQIYPNCNSNNNKVRGGSSTQFNINTNGNENSNQPTIFDQTFSQENMAQEAFEEAVQSIKGPDKANKASFDLLYQIYLLLGEGGRVEIIDLPMKVQGLMSENKQNSKFISSMKELMTKCAPSNYFESSQPSLKLIWKFIKKIMEEYSILKTQMVMISANNNLNLGTQELQKDKRNEQTTSITTPNQKDVNDTSNILTDRQLISEICKYLSINADQQIIQRLQELTNCEQITLDCCQLISTQSNTQINSPQQLKSFFSQSFSPSLPSNN